MTKRLSFLRRNSAGGKRARKRGPSSGGGFPDAEASGRPGNGRRGFPPFSSLSLSMSPSSASSAPVPGKAAFFSPPGLSSLFALLFPFLLLFSGVFCLRGALSPGGRIAFDREQAGQAVGVFRQRSRVVGRAGRVRAQPVKSAARECACPGREKQTGRANTGRPHVPDGTKNAQLFEDTTYFEKIH